MGGENQPDAYDLAASFKAIFWRPLHSRSSSLLMLPLPTSRLWSSFSRLSRLSFLFPRLFLFSTTRAILDQRPGTGARKKPNERYGRGRPASSHGSYRLVVSRRALKTRRSWSVRCPVRSRNPSESYNLDILLLTVVGGSIPYTS